jgi:hypothetical protein
MQIANTQDTARTASRRAAYGALAAVLLVAAIALPIAHGGGWWLFSAFIIGPDLALLLGISSRVEQGRLHPRAVPLYNGLHSYWGPALLALAAIVLPVGAAIGALAWGFHISLDRCLGYGKRTRDGFQRA